MDVFTRLFIWAEVGAERKTALIERVMLRVRAAVRRGTPILWVTDGFGAWADFSLVQVVKRKAGRRLVAIEQHLRLGPWAAAQEIMCCSQTQLGAFNTAYVERLNATLRTWLPALTRRSRTPARDLAHLEAALFWTGCVYNFCRIHATLDGTPAMAAGLTE